MFQRKYYKNIQSIYLILFSNLIYLTSKYRNKKYNKLLSERERKYVIIFEFNKDHNN